MSTLEEDLAALDAELAAFRASKPTRRIHYGALGLLAVYIAGALYALLTLVRSSLPSGGSGASAANTLASVLAALMLSAAAAGLASAVKRSPHAPTA